jgi:hypothetical protein
LDTANLWGTANFLVFLKLYTNLNIHNKNIKGLSTVNFVSDYISPKIFAAVRALII